MDWSEQLYMLNLIYYRRLESRNNGMIGTWLSACVYWWSVKMGATSNI